jgi:predicted neuraminidase
MKKIIFLFFISFLSISSFAINRMDKKNPPMFSTDAIFPLQNEHTHGSSIIELKNGDLLIAWFQGSGERWADDVKILGARKKKELDAWSEPFVLADTKEFPDCNPVLFIDDKDRLWLMWIAIIANQWETSLIKYLISEDYQDMSLAPVWCWQDVLLIKPGDKAQRGIQPNDSFVKSVEKQLNDYLEYVRSESDTAISYTDWGRRIEHILSNARGENMLRSGYLYKDDGTYDTTTLGYPYFSRMGWQTRNKPFITNTGRIIIPLYSDGYSFSIMAYTDDSGSTWKFSEPLVGAGNIQPAIAQTKSGKLITYMRDNGPAPKRIHISSSDNLGETWAPARDTDLPNPGSACDIAISKEGNWILVYNDTESGRNKLCVALSDDEGKTWGWKKYIENEEIPVQVHYPAVIIGNDGIIHVSYSYFTKDKEKTIKHAAFNQEWITTK